MQTSATAPTDTPAAPAGKAASPSKAAARAAYLADAAARRAAEPPAEEKDPAAALDAPVESEVEPTDDVDETGEETPAEPPPAKAKEEPLDPAAVKRMEASQKEERRRKEQIARERAEASAAIAKERAEIETQRKAVEAERKELEEFKQLRGRAKYAPAAVLKQLGLTDEDFEAAAQELYASSPKGAADPKAREYVARLQRERELAGRTEKQGGEVAELRSQIDELKKLVESSKTEQTSQAKANEYLDAVEDSIGDDHPVVSRALAAAKAKATDRTVPVAERREAQQTVRALRDEFLAAAVDLYQRDGVEPEPSEVAAEVEQRRVAAMKRWGIDPTALAAPTAKKPNGAPPPRVLGKGNGAPAQPPRQLTPDEKRAEFVRLRQSGKIGEG